jgi:hypothetical protein
MTRQSQACGVNEDYLPSPTPHACFRKSSIIIGYNGFEVDFAFEAFACLLNDRE